MAFKDIHSENSQTKLTIADIESLNVNKLNVNQLDDIRVASINLSGVSATTISSTTSLLKSKNITIDDVRLKRLKDIAINSVDIDTLITHIKINKQAEFPLLDKLIASFKTNNSDPTPAKTADTEKPAAFQLAELNISKNSRIHFSKQTKEGIVKKEIHLNKMHMGNINSLATTQATPIAIDATIDKFSTFTLKGRIYPFSENTNLKLYAKLSAFELPEFSPIIREQLGYNIQNGQLNADVSIKIKENILDGETKLEINQLTLEAADENKMAQMTQQLTMPLDSALSLLRDSNDDIKLNIPVKGDISSPDFNISNIINTALGNALQGTVKNVLKYALQPYGLIFMAAEKAYGVATAIKLDAIAFPPGDSALSPDSSSYIQRIGELMQKKPHLRIRVCGFSTKHDQLLLEKTNISDSEEPLPTESIDSTQNDLLELAKSRASAVKAHLISSYNIDASRLFTCNPKVETNTDSDNTAPPRVELLI
ncbi:MAG: hypothetical protein A6F70_00095 [Cycloclasticus sp. symbiont of Bathymodiolus heckerae]|nr:MAG: hypothetical protein A6F70_00095 [Cycloclasticus sp. symbiont of Bathymodiolus heckerae]